MRLWKLYVYVFFLVGFDFFFPSICSTTLLLAPLLLYFVPNGRCAPILTPTCSRVRARVCVCVCVCVFQADCGGIYNLGPSHGTTIHHNIVYNTRSTSVLAEALYFDEGSSGITAENNVIVRRLCPNIVHPAHPTFSGLWGCFTYHVRRCVPPYNHREDWQCCSN